MKTVLLFCLALSSAHAFASDPFLEMARKKNAQADQQDRDENQCFIFANDTAHQQFRRLKAVQGMRGISRIYINEACNEWHKGSAITVHENIVNGADIQKIPVSINNCRFEIIISTDTAQTTAHYKTTYADRCQPKISEPAKTKKWTVRNTEQQETKTIYGIVDEDIQFCGIIVVRKSPSFTTLPYETVSLGAFSTFEEAASRLCNQR